MNVFSKKRKTRDKKTNAINRGIREEKRIAKRRGCKHVGGPGQPDFICPNGTTGEVKARKTKVTQPELKKYGQNGIGEVHSEAGFTRQAVDYRNRYRPNMTLFQGRKSI